MGARLVLLGTGTCQLQSDRLASSVLIELEDLRVVFDFGRGIAGRLSSFGLEQDDVRHVVLSHFHPDHLSDLIPYLHAASWSRTDPRTRALHLYGPRGLEKLVHGLRTLFDSLVRDETFAIHLHEILEDRFVIDGQEFLSCGLPPAGNRGLKFAHGGTTCALTGDSAFHDDEIGFLRDVDLAIIDAGHLSDDEIVELAARTQVRRLVCSHLYRQLDRDGLAAASSQRGFRGELIVGEDLMTFCL